MTLYIQCKINLFILLMYLLDLKLKQPNKNISKKTQAIIDTKNWVTF